MFHKQRTNWRCNTLTICHYSVQKATQETNTATALLDETEAPSSPASCLNSNQSGASRRGCKQGMQAVVFSHSYVSNSKHYEVFGLLGTETAFPIIIAHKRSPAGSDQTYI